MAERSVSAGGNIERSVVVTGDGNSVRLSFGERFELPLERRQIPLPRRAKSAPNPLSLLAPDAGVIPLAGRQPLLADLKAWLDADADVSVFGLIARAGTGKTRLALELCRAVDAEATPGAKGWAAGFVRPGDISLIVDRLATESHEWTAPTLLVIDYAAAGHRDLARWFDRLARSPDIGGKLRFLLLDREAPQGFGWWHDLTTPLEHSVDTRRDLFANPDAPLRLPDLDDVAMRRAVLNTARDAAANLSSTARPAELLPPPGLNARFDAELAGPRFGNPLNLAMAGLIAVERGPVEALALRRLDAARHLARHEIGRMDGMAAAAGLDRNTVRHILGFNGLAGGMSVDTLRTDIAAECAAANLPVSAGALADLLQQELTGKTPDSGGEPPRLATIQPDLIGEAVIVETLLTGPPDRRLAAPRIVERAYALTGGRAAAALMLLIQDFGPAADDPAASPADRDLAATVLRLLTALAEALPDEDIDRLETLVFAIPYPTTVLRETAATQTGRLAAIWSDLAQEPGNEIAKYRAGVWLNNLAARLSDLGQREAALTAAQESVELHRVLAAARPDAFVPDLAGSLSNLANRLSNLGQREAALTAAQESVELHRVLAAARPDAFVPDLAGSLNNLANFLSNLGQREAALTAAQEAVELHRVLAAARPDAFVPVLAGSLNNLANVLSDLGQREAALTAAQESVDLRRVLAAARPDAFAPDLAGSLNNLASRLSALGQREAALTAAQESVELHRVLAAARPDAFVPNLAGSLNNLANRLSDLDQREAALAAAQEAVELRRVLAAARPDAFVPDLAMSLSVLGDRLEECERMGDAVAADHDSIATLAPYFHARPAVFAGAMASHLRDHIRRAEKAGTDVDAALVAPIIETLTRLQKEQTS